MPTAQIVSTISVGGVEFASNVSRTAEGQISHVVVIPAGAAGKRAADGVDNLVTGHGFVTSNVIDVHWTDPTDGVTHKVRRGLTVDGATANAITFDETPPALGDTFPAVGTDVVISLITGIGSVWDGDLLEMIAMKATGRLMAEFWDGGVQYVPQKLATEQALTWVAGQGVTNPYTGSPVAVIRVSNGTIVAVTYTLGLLYQSV